MKDNDDLKPFESSRPPVRQKQSEKHDGTARPIDELIEFINRNCPDCSYDPNAPEKAREE